MKLLAIDIGASGGKAVAGEFKSGTLESAEVRRFPNSIVEIHGRRHWDILRLFEEVKECLRAVPDAESVGIDTWAVDYGYIGADGDLVGLPFAYRDSRTEHSIPIVHDRIPRDELYSLTGIQFLPFNTVYQIAEDVLSRPWIVDNAHRLLMIPELLGYLLTGRPVAEYTNASTTGFLDVRNRSWSVEILNRIGFPHDLLPGIVQPGETSVDLAPAIAGETGCSAKLTFPACHDTACAVAAVPAMHRPEGAWAFISSGTWSLVGMETRSPIVTDEARDANFTNEGGIDGTIRFLTNVTGFWLIEELRRAWARDGQDVGFETIVTEAEKAPWFKSLINPDHPSFAAPDDMRVAIRRFCEETDQTVPKGIGPLSRCVFESLAFAYRRKIRRLGRLTGESIDRIHVVGGGARNALVCQMTADACGIPVIAGPAEATATGNLLVQAVSAGVVSNTEEGRRIIADSFDLRAYHPTMSQSWDYAADKFDNLLSH